MNKIWENIQQDVEKENWYVNNLQDLYNKNLDTILIRQSVIHKNIKRNGDVVVGFYNADESNPKTLKLEIGGREIPELHLQPKTFSYIFENTHVYPILTIAFSELHVQTDCYNNLHVVYAFIRDSHLRRELAQRGCIIRLRSGKIMTMHGIFEYQKCPHSRQDRLIEIPAMTANSPMQVVAAVGL